jgi:hypothetical protein
MTNKEAALQYYRNGFPVIPVHRLDATGACTCGKPEECIKPGKHPRIGKWSTVTCDEAAIEQWWAEDPEANIGLRLDTLIVVDVDTHDPEKNGFVSLEALQREAGAILESPCKQHSGGGGEHVLFAEVRGTAKHPGFRAGLDLLTGPGSFILVEPSMHPDGGNYHWIDEANPMTTHRDALALAVPPDWLLYEASKPTPKAASKAAKPAANTKPTDRVSVERLMTMAVDRIKGGTGRNDTGLWFFNQLRDNGYAKDEAFLPFRNGQTVQIKPAGVATSTRRKRQKLPGAAATARTRANRGPNPKEDRATPISCSASSVTLNTSNPGQQMKPTCAWTLAGIASCGASVIVTLRCVKF